MPDERQLQLGFEAADRDAERVAATPQKNDRRNRIVHAEIEDGFDDYGQRVKAHTLRLALLALNSFGDLRPSTETIGLRCGDKNWRTLIPNGRKLSERTIKSAMQALERMDLVDRIDRGKRTERRVILWQNLRAPVMGATAPVMGATAPVMGATAAPQSNERKSGTLNNEDERDGAIDGSYAREEIRRRANRLVQAVRLKRGRTDDRLLLAKLAILWDGGILSEDDVEQVLESFDRHQVRNRVAWLRTALENRLPAGRLRKLLAGVVVPDWMMPAPLSQG